MSARPYKPSFQLENTLGIIEVGFGIHFDPNVGRAFLGLAPELFRLFGEQPEETLFSALTKLRLRHFGV